MSDVAETTALVHLPHPATGELIDLDDTTDRLAHTIADLRELRQMISGTIDTLSEELTDRLDQENTRSAEVNGWRIEGKAPFTTEYDPAQLREALLNLVNDGLLAAGVVDRTIPAVTSFKVDRREINKLKAHPDATVRQTINECGTQVPQKRTITVKPVRPASQQEAAE